MTKKRTKKTETQEPSLELTLKTSSIPDEVFEKTWLTDLTIKGGTLKSVSPRLAELENLTSLHLDTQSKLDLSDFPVMPKLENLGLRSCKLKSLPDTLFECTSLRWLSLGNNPLKAVPPAIGKLRNLTALYLWGCELREVPEALGELTSLRLLELEKNKLRALPDSLAKLAKLEDLRLEKNEFSVFPMVVCRLPKLAQLCLNENQLAAVPAEVTQLSALSTLRLEDNPLRHFPADLSGLGELTTFYLSLAITKEELKAQVRKLPPKAFMMSFDLGDLARDGRWADEPARPSSELVGAAKEGASERVFHHENRVTSVAFVRGGVAGRGYDKLRVFDFKTGQERFSQKVEGAFTIAAPPDGSVLAVARRADVQLLDPVSGEPRALIPVASVQRLNWSRDGSVLLLSTRDSLHFHDAKTQQELAKVTVPDLRPETATLSFDGARAVFGVKKSVCVWDRTTRKELLRTTVQRETIRHTRFSDDGAEVFVAGYEPQIHRLALGEKKPKPVTTRLPNAAEALALLPDRRVVTAGPKVRVFDLSSGEELATLGAHEAVGPVDDLVVSADGTLVASCGCDKTVRVWGL